MFIEDCRRLAWLDLGADFAVYLDDLPKLTDYGPRALDEHVMAQLDARAAIEAIPDNGLRGLIVVIMGTGLRADDACRLPFDALEHDATGAPYLRYFMNRMNREHRIPIDGRTEAAIVAQQQRVRDRYGDQRRFLFPQVHSNPAGQLPSRTRIAGHWADTPQPRTPGEDRGHHRCAERRASDLRAGSGVVAVGTRTLRLAVPVDRRTVRPARRHPPVAPPDVGARVTPVRGPGPPGRRDPM